MERKGGGEGEYGRGRGRGENRRGNGKGRIGKWRRERKEDMRERTGNEEGE